MMTCQGRLQRRTPPDIFVCEAEASARARERLARFAVQAHTPNGASTGEGFRLARGEGIMAQAIDHVVIAVRDLARASTDYETLGFTVTPGGEHVTGGTHNALVSFADGAYFELIAFKEPDRPQEHKWWAKFQNGEGTVDFALLATSLDVEGDRLSEAGLQVAGPIDGGRQRPDGQQLAWKTITLAADDVPLPFVIEDLTLRELRVPPGDAARHPNGASGIAGLTLLVPDLDRASQAYAALLETEGEAVPPPIEGVRRGRRFTFGSHWIELAEPEGDAAELHAQIRDRGAAPYEIVLGGVDARAAPLPPELTHAARIRFA